MGLVKQAHAHQGVSELPQQRECGREGSPGSDEKTAGGEGEWPWGSGCSCNVQLLGNKMGKKERPQMASARAFRPTSNTIKV